VNPGLVYLLAKGPRVLLRRLERRFRGRRGKLALVGIVLFIGLVVAPQVIRYIELRDNERFVEIAAMIRLVGPAGFVLLVLATAMHGGIYFKPAEIQFLFPAPIGRRELLVYDVLSKFRVQALSGLWVTIFTVAYSHLWYAAIVGMTLAFALLQLSAQTIGLLLVALAERYGNRARRLVVAGIWLVLAGGFANAVFGGTSDAGVSDMLGRFAAFPPIDLLSWIARPPVRAFLAESPVELTLWTAASIAILTLLVAVMAVLDVTYSEGALERAEKVQARLARIRSGGAFAAAGPRKGGLKVPLLPFWGGAGPFAWRQLQELTRNYRAALMLGAFMLLFVGMFTVIPTFVTAPGGGNAELPATFPLVMLIVITPMMSMNAAFDFRRDLDRMALLKSYPVSGFALALGQVLSTTLLVTGWEIVAVVVLTVVSGDIPPPILFGIVIALLPLNAVLIAFDNALFLKLPYRIVASDPGRIPFMPRLMLVMFLKMLLLFLLAGVTAIPGAIAWVFTRSIVVTALVIAVFLGACAVWAVIGVAAAFKSFDVSSDIPD
jgi:hypothetical protein